MKRKRKCFLSEICIRCVQLLVWHVAFIHSVIKLTTDQIHSKHWWKTLDAIADRLLFVDCQFCVSNSSAVRTQPFVCTHALTHPNILAFYVRIFFNVHIIWIVWRAAGAKTDSITNSISWNRFME